MTLLLGVFDWIKDCLMLQIQWSSPDQSLVTCHLLFAFMIEIYFDKIRNANNYNNISEPKTINVLLLLLRTSQFAS
jgi:hypothetical protein